MSQEGGTYGYVNQIPRTPTSSRGVFRFNPFALALPSEVNSVLSLVFLVVTVSIVLVSPAHRMIFRLPFHAAFLAVPALLLAMLVTVKARGRPGPIIPRLWCFALFLICLGVAGLTFAWPYLSAPDLAGVPATLALGCLGSALMLSVRLLWVPPNSRTVHRIGPIVLLVLALLMAGTIKGSFSYARESEADKLITKQKRMEDLRKAHQKVMKHSWASLSGDLEGTQKHLEELERISQAERVLPAIPNTLDWKQAKLLNMEEPLLKTYKGLVAQVATAWTTGKFPRMGLLKDNSIHTTDYKGRWRRSTSLEKLSTIVAGYHRTNWELLILTRLPMDSGTKQPSRTLGLDHYDKEEKLVLTEIKKLAETYSDNWIEAVLKNESVVGGFKTPPLIKLLALPLVDGTTYFAGDIARLLAMDLDTAQQLSLANKGCLDWKYAAKSKDYFRLDCTAYIAARNRKEALPWLEVRVVWSGENQTGPPTGIWYTLVIPDKSNRKTYLNLFMKTFYETLKGTFKAEVKPLDLKTDLSEGFLLTIGEDQFKVRPYTRKDRNAPDGQSLFGKVWKDKSHPEQATVEIWVENKQDSNRNRRRRRHAIR